MVYREHEWNSWRQSCRSAWCSCCAMYPETVSWLVNLAGLSWLLLPMLIPPESLSSVLVLFLYHLNVGLWVLAPSLGCLEPRGSVDSLLEALEEMAELALQSGWCDWAVSCCPVLSRWWWSSLQRFTLNSRANPILCFDLYMATQCTVRVCDISVGLSTFSYISIYFVLYNWVEQNSWKCVPFPTFFKIFNLKFKCSF